MHLNESVFTSVLSSHLRKIAILLKPYRIAHTSKHLLSFLLPIMSIKTVIYWHTNEYNEILRTAAYGQNKKPKEQDDREAVSFMSILSHRLVL